MEITPTRANFAATGKNKESYVSPCEVLGFQSIEPTPVQDFKSQETPEKKKSNKRQKVDNSSDADVNERKMTTRSNSTMITEQNEESGRASTRKTRTKKPKTLSQNEEEKKEEEPKEADLNGGYKDDYDPGKTDLKERIREDVGFSEIIEILKSAKKPIVGHNLMFDLVFTYQQFINDLPDTY